MSFDPIAQMQLFLQMRRDREAREAREEERKQRAFQAAMQVAQTPGMSVQKAAPSFAGLDPAAMPFLLEVEKATNKRFKEGQATEQLGNVIPGIREMAPATAGVLQPGGRIERTESANRAMAGSVGQVSALLPNLPPELQPLAASLPASLRAAQETGLQQTAADRQFARQEDQRQIAAREAAQLRAEKRSKLSEYGSSVALGLAAGTVTEEEARVVLTNDLGDARAVAQVMNQAAVERSAQAARLTKTAEGETEAQALANAFLAELQERTGGTYIGADGKERPITKEDAILRSKGRLGVVDIAGKSYKVTAESAAKLAKVTTYQDQYASVDDMLGELMDIGGRIEQRVAAGESVPGVGPGFPEFGASALRFVGQEDPDVGPYEGTNLLVTMELIRLQQEGRLSDYDAKSYLAVMPSRQQIGTSQGRARLEQVRRLMTTARLANITPAQRATVQRERAQKRQLSPDEMRATNRLDAVVQKMVREGNVEGVDPQAVALKYQEELSSALEAWNATGASRKWDVMPKVQDPALAPLLSDPSLFPKPGL